MEEGRGPAPTFYHTIECIRLGVYPVPRVIPISDYPKAGTTRLPYFIDIVHRVST